MKHILTEEDFATHPELKDAGFQIGDEVEIQEDGSFVGSTAKEAQEGDGENEGNGEGQDEAAD